MILYCTTCRIKINTQEYGLCPCPRCDAKMLEYIGSDPECARVAWRFPFVELSDETLRKLQVVSRIKKNWKLKTKVEGNVLAERDPVKPTPVTTRRQEELNKTDKHYLADLYGLRVISAWTPPDAQLDITIQHRLSTSYLRDAYDDPKKKGAEGTFNAAVDKLLKAKKKAKKGGSFYFPVNSPDVVSRLRYQTDNGTLSACTILCGVPGLHVLEVTVAAKVGAKPSEGEGLVRQYLKEIGATPSTYQAYKYVHHDGKEPALGGGDKVKNDMLLSALLRSEDFRKLEKIAASNASIRHVYATSVHLLKGLDKEVFLRSKDKFKRGLLVQDALKSLAGIVEILAASSGNAARCARYYDLLLDEVFLILSAVGHYRKEDLLDAEASIQDRRNPLMKRLVAAEGIKRVIHPAWSGMDALVTALEAARVVSGLSVHLMHTDKGQANYFEIPAVLAAQGRVAEGKGVDAAGIIYATLDPSSPLAAPTTPKEVVDTVRSRIALFDEELPHGVSVLSLVLDTTIQQAPKKGSHSHVDEVVGQLAYLVDAGKLQLFFARSYQKYQGLGSAKVMGGAVTLLRSVRGPSASHDFLGSIRTGGNVSRDEWQFFTHVLKHAGDEELGMIGVSTENAQFVATELFPNGGSVPYIGGLPFLMKEDQIESWMKNLDVLQLDSFGLVTSTFLGVVGLGTRVTIGQESRERLIEKFFAAGHLMPADFKKPKPPSFKQILFHVHSILQEVHERYQAGKAPPEGLPFAPKDPPLVVFGSKAPVAPTPTADDIVRLYRGAKGVRRVAKALGAKVAGDTDLDHVLASYLALGFLAIRAADTYRKSLITNPVAGDRLSLLRIYRGAFAAGLLDTLTPEGRSQLSAYWLEGLIELRDTDKSKELTPFLGDYKLTPSDAIAEPKDKGKPGADLAQQIADFGSYAPKHACEQLKRAPGDSVLAAAVKRFLNRAYEINRKGSGSKLTSGLVSGTGKQPSTSSKETIDVQSAWKTLKADVAEEKKKIDSALQGKEKEKTKGADAETLKLVLAVSVLDQIEKADTLADCYRAARSLPPDANLSEVGDVDMYDYVVSSICDLLAGLTLSKKIDRPVAAQVVPWKKVGDFQLTKTHQDMLQTHLNEYLDDRVIDAFLAIVEQRRAGVYRRFDVPVGLLVATARWDPPVGLQGVRAAGAARVEVQVINQGGNHWIVAVRFPQEDQNTVHVYDPLQPGVVSDPIKTQVRRCFNLPLLAQIRHLAGPRQPGGYECGAYVCAAIEVLSRTGVTPADARQALRDAAFVNNTIRGNLRQSIEAGDLQGF
ncbi:Ulp1 family isopeptidase [Chondromyces apiculatus]|uniref:Ubiquitin-like protease family profile domain-containing protein n=1 Tax=Chondromyces apiculatus DSM 436 TaxID=1192034 RepID=A0A017T7F6_9BACT|nr:Ulp1 family isopeptidase [Chondromyces apiculatus]EYF05159.1 Hypothetical protein CAP_3524 [Chondromyces apiculatus DSM 436]